MFYMRIYTSLLILLVTFRADLLYSTHLIGGEIFYDCLGNNQFKITLKVYRDCSPANTNGTPFDSQAKIGLFDTNGQNISIIPVSNFTVKSIPVIINNPCLIAPPNVCVEEATYEVVVTIPYTPGGVDIVYQRCCRNPTIVNLVQPQNLGNTYWTRIPESAWQQCNSSPRFKQFPPVVICTNDYLTFDHSAIDPDGDSLVYEFATPFHGGSPNNPMPQPSPPPFTQVPWGPGYSANYPMNANPPLQIDAHTGILTGQPTQQGQYVIGVKVKEYRNGILLSENLRDFQFNVALCDPTFIASAQEQQIFCDGKTVQFINQSQGASFYFWDFGDPYTNQDTSTQVNPVYTYTDTGTFTVMLIANPGWTCADTDYVTFEIREKLSAFFSPPAPQCINGNEFSFKAKGIYDPQYATFFWDFGPNAIPSSSTDSTPSGISYDNPGFYPVTLTIAHPDGCEKSFTDTVKVYPNPHAEFKLDTSRGCQPFTVKFKNLSNAWTPLSYFWTISDGTVNTNAEFTHTFTSPGSYDVSLTVITSNGCIDTASIMLKDIVTVYPKPTSYFTLHPDTIDIFNNQFELDNQSVDIIDCYYTVPWLNNSLPCFTQSLWAPDWGNYKIQQIVTNQFGCKDTSTKELFVKPIFLFYMPNAFTPDGDGINDEFRCFTYAYASFHLQIFDRWGELIFETNNPNVTWDGKFRSKEAAMGVYTVKVVIKDVLGEWHQYLEPLNLIR